ncbi:cyclic nucleotide-binding domain-containing protein [Sulfitobacter aestuarii]|uniref:Cyclic nucleotide-binding domain-containing protein n=1 Tax=Sulfitobacter aestuarii TaxID=2161676 RepID=A0ABW5U404_9RHOB
MSFIWTHSKRDQFILTCLTLLLFPLLYLTLELPKRIINDAIGAAAPNLRYLGLDMAQTTLLIALCLAFLASVIAHGLLKMRVNSYKGVLAERLLRRFRYTLIGRILRFPRSYQSRVSEGELVSMVTAEAEPLGGIMGDAIAHPLLQAGQMATILLFLFVQNLWFGLAAVALIPVQAWLIPRLQARINLLNRSRIRQVRVLASDIGELAAGAAILRQHGGWRYRMALIGQRLGGLFDTRFEIYRRKFFLKFINNLLTQLTPFFYFLVGGLLVINGQLTIGALVAALSAFKDLSSPWKELLTYYTAVQEMAQRYHLIIERFAPAELLGDFLADEPDAAAPDIPVQAALTLEGVVLQDEGGRSLLNDVDLAIAPGSWTCILAQDEEDRSAFSQLLLRELAPSAGRVLIDGTALTDFSQTRIAATLAHVNSAVHVFDGTVGDNVMVPLCTAPQEQLDGVALNEALRSGNSLDRADGPWRPANGAAELLVAAQGDWQRLVTITGAQKNLLSRVLDRRLAGPEERALQEQLIDARLAVRGRLREAGLADAIHAFGTDVYVDELTLPENLLFAISRRDGWLPEETGRLLAALIDTLGLRDQVLTQAVALARMLIEVFDAEATGSALFRRLGLPKELLARLRPVLKRRDGRSVARSRSRAADELLLLSLVFNLPASHFDGDFSAALKQAVVAARRGATAQADPVLTTGFMPLDETAWNPRLSVFENMIFGKIAPTSRPRREEIKALVVEILGARLDDLTLSELIRKLPTGLRGANLSPQLMEQISLSQAVIKRPAILILERALASHDEAARSRAFASLRDLLPEATIIQLEAELPQSGHHDHALELRRGRIVTLGDELGGVEEGEARDDLHRKFQALRKAPLFRDLSRQQLRMLAFSARWVEFAADSYVFRKGDLPDGAFLIYRGAVELIERTETGEVAFILRPPEGTLVGELGLLRNDPRRLDMRAQGDLLLLRIDAGDFLSVVETDARTAFRLIQNLIGYLDRPQ